MQQQRNSVINEYDIDFARFSQGFVKISLLQNTLCLMIIFLNDWQEDYYVKKFNLRSYAIVFYELFACGHYFLQWGFIQVCMFYLYFSKNQVFVFTCLSFCALAFHEMFWIQYHLKRFKGALSGLRRLLATKRSLKMMKNAFTFTIKALFVLKILKFL